MLTAGEDSPRLKAKNALGSTIKSTYNDKSYEKMQQWSLIFKKVLYDYQNDYLLIFLRSQTQDPCSKKWQIDFFFESDKQILREVIESDWMHEIPKEN